MFEYIIAIALATALLFWAKHRLRSAAPKPGKTDHKSQWNEGFSLNIVGESRRQQEVKRCRPGEPVSLIREPDNPHDPMAVRVDSVRGKPLGYLARDRAAWLGRKMDDGVSIFAEIEHVTGENQPSRGIVLHVRLDD